MLEWVPWEREGRKSQPRFGLTPRGMTGSREHNNYFFGSRCAKGLAVLAGVALQLLLCLWSKIQLEISAMAFRRETQR